MRFVSTSVYPDEAGWGGLSKTTLEQRSHVFCSVCPVALYWFLFCFVFLSINAVRMEMLV